MDAEIIKKFKVSFPEGEQIFKEGDTAEKLFFIQSGEVDIYLQIRNSRKKVATLGAGDIFGEMAVIDAKPRSATAIAKSAVTALGINREQLSVIINSNNDFAIKMIKLLSAKLREANDQIAELLMKDKRNLIANEMIKFSKTNGVKTFKGLKINLHDFIDSANQCLGFEKETIRTTCMTLLREKFIEQSATCKDEFILMEKLEKLGEVS